MSIDEFKGRGVPEGDGGGLHTAIGSRKRSRRSGGPGARIDHHSNLVALYPIVCGMTGTAATQADEFREIYQLEVEIIPTNRPVVRRDEPDAVFPTKAEKEAALVDEIARVYETGRPVLVGTASVEESERISRCLGTVPHQVLNARNEEAEAAIIARAGVRNAVTISTNMAGRGVDIQLGPGVAELGGLHVIGTNRMRAADRQPAARARGTAGRSGSSQFFVSYQDPLMGSTAPMTAGWRIPGQHSEGRRRAEPRHSSFPEKVRVAARRTASGPPATASGRTNRRGNVR